MEREQFFGLIWISLIYVLSMYHQEETRYGIILEFGQIFWSGGCLGVVEVFASR